MLLDQNLAITAPQPYRSRIYDLEGPRHDSFYGRGVNDELLKHTFLYFVFVLCCVPYTSYAPKDPIRYAFSTENLSKCKYTIGNCEHAF